MSSRSRLATWPMARSISLRAQLERGRRPLVELLRQLAHGHIAPRLDLAQDGLHRCAHLRIGRLDRTRVHSALQIANHGCLPSSEQSICARPTYRQSRRSPRILCAGGNCPRPPHVRHPGAARKRSERAGPGRDLGTLPLALGCMRRSRGKKLPRPLGICRVVQLTESVPRRAWAPAGSRSRPLGHSRRRDDATKPSRPTQRRRQRAHHLLDRRGRATGSVPTCASPPFTAPSPLRTRTFDFGASKP